MTYWERMHYGPGTMFGAYLIGQLDEERFFAAPAIAQERFWRLVARNYDRKLESSLTWQERRERDDEAVMHCNEALAAGKNIFQLY